MPIHKFQNPADMPPTRGYTHIVEAAAPGRTVYFSGQLGLTREGKFAGGDFRAQATQCFENLKAALAAAGGDFRHVVRITNYFVDISNLPTFFEIRDRYVDSAAPPASTAIQVVRLALPDALFELEAIAVIPS